MTGLLSGPKLKRSVAPSYFPLSRSVEKRHMLTIIIKRSSRF